jgi:glycosyltransferase involved in cell wall biosynthesis
MRILVVTNTYPTPYSPASGAFVKQQVLALRMLGLEVDVLFADRVQKGISVYFELGKLVRERIATFQPNVVHVRYGGVMADIVTRTVHDRPTILTLCGSDIYGEPLCGFARRLSAAYGVRATHKAVRRASGIVAVARRLLDALPKDFDWSKIWIIPGPVDLELFKPLDRAASRLRLGWDDNRFHILFSSRASRAIKRIALAQAAVCILDSLGIPAVLHELCDVPHHEVPVWLNASDVVILTSAHEGSPNIIKEALACNRPVVSVDVGDIRERIEGIEGCYLARPAPDDLSAKLRLVFNGLRQVQGRAKVEDLSLKRIAKRLSDVYVAVLKRAASTSKTVLTKPC